MVSWPLSLDVRLVDTLTSMLSPIKLREIDDVLVIDSTLLYLTSVPTDAGRKTGPCPHAVESTQIVLSL